MRAQEKRRCARNVDDGSTSMDVKEEKMGEKGALGGDNKHGVELQDHMSVSCSNSEEEVNIGAKRARKLASQKRDDFMSHLCCFNKPEPQPLEIELLSITFSPWTSQPSYSLLTSPSSTNIESEWLDMWICGVSGDRLCLSDRQHGLCPESPDKVM